MIEILKGIIDLLRIFIDGIFNFKIEFRTGHYVSLGFVVIAFVFLVLVIYLLFKTIGIKKGGDNNA